jgi:hypothetical protein
MSGAVIANMQRKGNTGEIDTGHQHTTAVVDTTVPGIDTGQVRIILFFFFFFFFVF